MSRRSMDKANKRSNIVSMGFALALILWVMALSAPTANAQAIYGSSLETSRTRPAQ